MAKYGYEVNIEPEKAARIIKNAEFADLLHEDIISEGNGKTVITLVFEKYYMRVEGRAALVVIIENVSNTTEVRVITAGTSKGMIFNFDWGASDNFAYNIKELLSDYITGEREIG